MNLAYPAHFERDGDSPHLWNVRIPGLDGTEEGPMTGGDSIEDARSMASGLVDSWIYIHLKQGTPIPTPGPLSLESGWELARPSIQMQFVATLKHLRSQAKLSQADAAQRMGIKQPVYARLEDPKLANPTLKTVQAACKAFGVSLDLVASNGGPSLPITSTSPGAKPRSGLAGRT